MSKDKLYGIAKEIDKLWDEVESIREGLRILGKASMFLSMHTNFAMLFIMRMHQKITPEILARTLKHAIDFYELLEQLPKHPIVIDVLKTYGETLRAGVKALYISFLEYAKEYNYSFENALHALHSSFNNWSFLKYISDDVVLETYGSKALSILKKYKETFLSSE